MSGRIMGNCNWCESVGIPVESPCDSCEDQSSCDAPHKGFRLCESCFELHQVLLGDPSVLLEQAKGLATLKEGR